MARKVMRLFVFVLALSCATLAFAGPAKETAKAPMVPVIGMVTVVEFGAEYCPPCRLMKPILQNAQREYRGRAAVVTVDVTRYQSLATRLDVRVIPTLVFYDAMGQELARHEGYLDKRDLYAQLDKMLAK
ncbi:MAG TPA: thioredoxin family protein [Humidesulfovibrio sp.]|uniref:thioredoxin family protein n=1 Tax=Humidesulfovibrio sp. TaxID=2910988 RepID=UPI002C1F6994|nr:thioredoxin family protein [Humidesulfovibrio sp.]HWR03778.1 thioredoxin family protein [Humidesulfovibrio sp.]